MKLVRFVILFWTIVFAGLDADGQANAYVNILSQNGGVMTIGGNVFVEVTVGNSGPADVIPGGKIIAQLSVPGAIVSIPATGHILPPGWTIVSNSGTSIQVCNSSDIIPLFDERTILINLQGNVAGGPSTIIGQLDFRNNCTSPGTLNGDDNSDNSSTTTIQVVAAIPCTLGISATAGTILCNGGTTILTATPSGQNGTVEYSLNGGAYQTSNTFTINAVGSPYTVTARELSNPTCTASASPVTVTEPAVFPSPTVNVVHPTCTLATGTITITSSTTGLTFSFDGGAYAAYPVGGYTVTAGAHTLTAQNGSGCISAVTNITVDAQPATPAAPIVSIVQPTCTVATGTITITSSTTGLTFSLDGGAYAAYPVGGYIVAAGPHTLTAQNGSGCISAVTNFTVDVQPATPAAPTVSIVQPTCTVATGTITITSSTTGLIFSLDAGAYAAYPVGGYFVGAGAHTLTAQSGSGCISAITNITIDPQPATPAAPTAGAITQPSCEVSTGSVILGGLPAGNWIINPGALAGNTTTATVSGLASGTYNFTVTNQAGCTSLPSGDVVINTIAGVPSSPAVSVVQPTCTIATGTITITSSTTGLTFSLDGGPYAGYPAGGYIAAAGAHTLTAQNASGCISAVTNISVNAQPATPAAPTVSVIQPTCTVATGTITITSSTIGLTFSLDGGPYTAYPVGGYILATGAYILTAQNSNGCISAITNITVDAQPTTPAAPTVGAITQPTCIVSTGSVVLGDLPAGNWIINPGAIAGNTATATVSGLAAGTYNFTVTNQAGCISLPSADVVINTVIGAPAAPTVSVIQPNCTVATGTISITSSTEGLTFSFDGGPYTAYPIGGYIVASGPHTLTAQNVSSCTSPFTNITINPQPATPAAPAVSVVHPSCTVATGTITITSATAGLTFSLDGGAYAAYPVGGYVVPTGAHTLTAQNGSGCISAITNINIDAQPTTPAAPTVGAITPPTCIVSTGSVVLGDLPAGNWIINPGAIAGNTATTTVSGLTPGTYNFTVTNEAGCTSAASANVVIDNQTGPPAAPTVSVVQPTCTVATGTITITSSTTGLTFSLDGGAYAAYPVGGYVVAAGSHTLTAQNSGGCISAVTNIIVDPQPATPASPTISVVQPTCTVATGTITIISATTGLTFSLDGGSYATYPVGGYIVAAGGHTLTAQNGSGCISAVTNITIDPQPATPAAPTVSIVQPTCTVATGTITITSATTGSTFSLDGGAYATYPVGGYSVATGAHTLAAQNSSGCISAVTNITVNAQPATPAAATVSIVHPTCTVATGTITITSSTAGLTFSLDGGSYAVYPVGGYTVAAGAHTLTVQNTSGCISAVTNITVNAQPATPAAPTVSIVQPTCTVATGTITITSSTTGLTFSLDGGAYAAYPVGGYILATGAHTLTAQNGTGCISAVTIITINAQPATPAAPTVNVVQPTCTVATGTITITPPTTGLTFSLDGGAFAAYPTGGYVVSAGAHTLRAQNSSGCISALTNAMVNVQPASPIASASAGTILCFGGTTTLNVTASGGTGPYEYSLNGGTFQSVNTFIVSIGTYTVVVRDANLCLGTASAVTVTQPSSISATLSVGTIPCFAGTTTLTVAATGGTAPYQYRLNNGTFQASNIFIQVGPGSYTVTVRDANLCTVTTSAVTVTQPANLVASSTAPRITQCGGTTQVLVTASGGRSPYTGTGTFTRGPGTWSFPVTDASGCTTTTQITIEAPGCMNLRVFPNPASNSINVNHSSATTGSFMQVVSMNGAVVISKAVPQNAFLTTVDISRLAAGPYILVYSNGKDKREILFVKIPSN